MRAALRYVATMTLMITQQTMASQQAFVMREKAEEELLPKGEEELPPYKLVPAGNLSDYEITPFYVLDSFGNTASQAAVAFTLLDIVYTDDNVFCETEVCREARNFSYDPFHDFGAGYFPPVEMETLVELLSNQCNMTPANQSITMATLGANQSRICDYYTLYSPSVIPNGLTACIEQVFTERWPQYCANQVIDTALPEVALTMMGLTVPILALWRGLESYLKEGEKRNKDKQAAKIVLSILAMAMVSVPEATVFFFTGSGFVYTLPKLMNEYGVNIFTPTLFPTAIKVFSGVTVISFVARMLTQTLGLARQSTCLAFYSNAVYLFLYTGLRAASIFTLTLEFYNSQFGYTDDFFQAIVGASLMGCIAFVKTFRDFRLVDGCRLFQKRCTGDDCPQDYISNIYTHLHVLLTSLLTPVICASFLETFSTMTITAGSKPYMQTLSYFAFIAMSYCANSVAKNKESFELVYEPIMEFLESWAFFHTAYLNIVTHQESIDRAMFYYYYSNDPLIFAGLLASARVLYLFYQLSASELPAHIKHTLLSYQPSQKRSVLTAEQMTDIATYHPGVGLGGDYKLLAQTTEASKKGVYYTPYEIGRLKIDDLAAILLRSTMGGHHLCKLIEYFTTAVKPPPGTTVSAGNPHAKVAYDAASEADRACQAVVQHAYQGTPKAMAQATEEAARAIQAATTVMVLAANTHHLAREEVRAARTKRNTFMQAMVHYEKAKYTVSVEEKCLNQAENSSKRAVSLATQRERVFDRVNRLAMQARREADQAHEEAGLEHQAREAEARAADARVAAAEAREAANQAQAALEAAQEAFDEANRQCDDAKVAFESAGSEFALEKSKRDAEEAVRVANEIRCLVWRANESARQAAQEADEARERPVINSKEDVSDARALQSVCQQEVAEKRHIAIKEQYDAYMAEPDKPNPIIQADFGDSHRNTKIGVSIKSSPGHFKIGIPTSLFMLACLSSGSVPFWMNLNDAISSVWDCVNGLNDLDAHNLLAVTCASECSDFYPKQTSLQDIGSSWFVLVCYITVGIAGINFASLPYKKALTQCLFSRCAPNTRYDQRRFPPKSWLVPATFFLLSIPSFTISGLSLLRWPSAFELNAKLNLNCSPDAPFVISKGQLKEAGFLSLALGIVTVLPAPLYGVIISVYSCCCPAIRASEETSHATRASTVGYDALLGGPERDETKEEGIELGSVGGGEKTAEDDVLVI